MKNSKIPYEKAKHAIIYYKDRHIDKYYWS